MNECWRSAARSITGAEQRSASCESWAANFNALRRLGTDASLRTTNVLDLHHGRLSSDLSSSHGTEDTHAWESRVKAERAQHTTGCVQSRLCHSESRVGPLCLLRLRVHSPQPSLWPCRTRLDYAAVWRN